ncbi:serine hydrolase [Pedobacter caeni]|uniref:CubicO group peptidase, beta-lactamase class C family n=1 Tax=Pedobacter caeni TaxID=288992 RepID=A0A1M4W118_9SPHI|nr:serine hydrolase [Pedobacter caeni]SHE74906.1 CubicO group peptidase, beta-lactamase class C family [Pedobacter caeni]
MKKNASVLGFFLLISLQYSNIYAQYDRETEAQIRKVESGLIRPNRFVGDSVWTIEGRMKHFGVPGLSIAVIKNSKVVWAKSYGIVDRGTKQPVTNQTLFQAASISKPVSAYAALKEVERGKINPEENVNTYLKSWKLPDNQFTKEKKVNLKHLLSHSGGLTVGGFAGYPVSEKIPTLTEVLDGKKPANSPAIRVDKVPGGTFRYSGGGYCVMQQMLIDLEGKPFPQIMDELVLGPLGMKNSSYRQPLPADRLKFAATGYLPDGSETKGKRHTYPEMAPAGLWTTAEDLAKFAIDLQLTIKGQSKKVLSQAMAVQMVSPFIEEFEGLGIFLEKKGNDRYFGHGGWNEGFSSRFTASKDSGDGVVVLTNGNQPPLVDELIRAVAATYNWPNYVSPVYQKLELDKGELDYLSGRYRTDRSDLMRIYREGGKVFLMKNSEQPEELFKIADHTFVVANSSDYKIKVVINPADQVKHLAFIWGTDAVKYINPVMKTDEKVPYEFILEGQFDQALAAYQQMKKEHPDYHTVGQRYLTDMGYRLLRIKEIKKAIDLFKVNAFLYPEESDVYDSLGEAYLADGDKKLGKENYLKALKLNPNNDNAAKIVKSLE